MYALLEILFLLVNFILLIIAAGVFFTSCSSPLESSFFLVLLSYSFVFGLDVEFLYPSPFSNLSIGSNVNVDQSVLNDTLEPTPDESLVFNNFASIQPLFLAIASGMKAITLSLNFYHLSMNTNCVKSGLYHNPNLLGLSDYSL